MKLARLLALACVLWISSCATCAPYQNVGIESAPEGAEVFLDGEWVGTTPLRLAISTASDHSVYLKKQGYRPELVVLSVNRPSDHIDFLTPADIRVHLRLRTGAPERDLELRVDPDDPAE